jgi:hypothetical protein
MAASEKSITIRPYTKADYDQVVALFIRIELWRLTQTAARNWLKQQAVDI